MKFLVLLAFALATCGLEACDSHTIKTVANKSEITWMTDFEQAKALAKAQSKPLFLSFSGSDWCPHCIRFNNEILSTPEFAKALGQKMIFVEIDFPRKTTLDPATKAQNKALADEYKVRGFPTVIILDKNLNQLGTLGYMKGGPDAFVKEVNGLLKK